MKNFRLLLTLLTVSVCSLQSAWADDVKVTVSLPNSNGLRTEILKSVNDVKIVTDLIVTTQTNVSLGAEDWATMQSMDALVNLDLSGTSAVAVPDGQFNGHCPNLKTVLLPNNLKIIGTSAFYYARNLTTVNIPSTLESLGDNAFYDCDKLENCALPADCHVTEIPKGCFTNCQKLMSFTIPESVVSIGYSAFWGCKAFTSALPSGLTSIGSYAFKGAAMTDLDIVIAEGTEIYSGIFEESGIKSISFPTKIYEFNSYIYNCSNLTDITLKSPTVIHYSVNAYWEPRNIENITLHVPSHLVDQYKVHTWWKDYKDVVAISPAVTSYIVQDNLSLNYAERMAGTPSLFFERPRSIYFSIEGNDPQAFNNFTAFSDVTTDYSYIFTYEYEQWYWTMILSECPNVSVTGDYNQRIKTASNAWYFLSLPFDFMVGDITTEEGKFAIRTYDGASRNTNDQSTGNWTNLSSGEIKAGTGFIFHTSKTTWTTFKAKSGGVNYAFKTSSDEPSITLAENNSNTSASAANTGWNFVGNPWQTYYNIHKMNYTSPICYWNGNSYVTVSAQDDDYAIKPNQAFFLQCPGGINNISFPASGRQLTDKITNQNGSRALFGSNRKLIDIQITCGEELKDKTRLVVNPEALFDYEIGRDASKFFSSETLCPQIYSLDVDGTQYAINERPDINSEIRLGVVFASDGTYEISAPRNAIGNVTLTDNETGIETDLSENSYSFEAKKGTNEKRFTLKAGSRGTTGIQTLTQPETNDVEVFTIDGQNVGKTTNGLKKGVYVVRQGKSAKKVIIK